MQMCGNTPDMVERLSEVRGRLLALREQGYKFIATADDGDSWVGSEQVGLEINDLIEHGFLGNVIERQPC